MQKTFLPADILLPKKDFEEWAVIACDQYTSDNEYWNNVKNKAADKNSTLNLVLPEIYLEENSEERIENINKTMSRYIDNDVFSVHNNSFIYVEREITGGKIRHGIVGMIDLEDYDYTKGSKALIRATEATVLERIPPRVKIRKDASLELPHVMLLIDDINKTVIEPLKDIKDKFKTAYDFELMQNSGHITGYFTDSETNNTIIEALDNLISDDTDKLMFAVGDGNHSLATAKECYRSNPNELNRYALVEIVNIHDESLEFEPIYRVLFDVNPEEFLNNLLNDFGGEYFGPDAQKFECIWKGYKKEISLKPTSKLSVGTLQNYLDSKAKNVKIDYIHGVDSVKKLCSNDNTLGFIFDSMGKSDLFPAVKSDGALPRKTFSMGHADDKRFYIEARKIK